MESDKSIRGQIVSAHPYVSGESCFTDYGRTVTGKVVEEVEVPYAAGGKTISVSGIMLMCFGNQVQTALAKDVVRHWPGNGLRGIRFTLLQIAETLETRHYLSDNIDRSRRRKCLESVLKAIESLDAEQAGNLQLA